MIRLLSVIALFAFCATQALAAPAESVPASVLPDNARVPGGVAVLQVPAGTEQARFEHKRVMLLSHDGQKYAIVGIPLQAKPGDYKISLGGSTVAFSVEPKAYKTQRLTITNKRQVNPLPADLKRIHKESRILNRAFSHFDTAMPVHDTFIMPADGPISSPFGMRRILNGEPRSPHSGIDIAAPFGASIRAAAAGRVLVTGDYFFDGNTVLLDHGQGLVTVYSHLSKTLVKPGQMVKSGQKIGEVGKTGRVTGPNLHWGVSLNGARVDPALFMRKSESQ